jgi:hypothetical protein
MHVVGCRNDDTYPRLADALGYVDKDDIFHAVKAIVATQRDYGRRDDRKQARLKYLVQEWGIDKFRWGCGWVGWWWWGVKLLGLLLGRPCCTHMLPAFELDVDMASNAFCSFLIDAPRMGLLVCNLTLDCFIHDVHPAGLLLSSTWARRWRPSSPCLPGSTRTIWAGTSRETASCGTACTCR